MLFKYYGEVEGLKIELEKYRKKLEEIYYELLGPVNFFRLTEISERILNEKSFIAFENLPKYTALKPATLANKIAIGIKEKVRVGRNGKIVKPQELTTFPLFVFHETGFEKSAWDKYGLPKYLTSYIHEFNHFLLYALQEKPIPVAMMILQDQIKSEYSPLSVTEIIQKLSTSIDSLNRKQNILIFALNHQVLEDFFEGTTRVLDAYILKRLGYDISHYPHLEEKKYFLLESKMLKMKIILSIGDPLYKLDIFTRLDFLFSWTKRMSFASGKAAEWQEFQRNFVKSFAQLKINKISFEQILQLN